nr:uncharacterized protein LOC127347538 [Lolium perenne]
MPPHHPPESPTHQHQPHASNLLAAARARVAHQLLAARPTTTTSCHRLAQPSRPSLPPRAHHAPAKQRPPLAPGKPPHRARGLLHCRPPTRSSRARTQHPQASTAPLTLALKPPAQRSLLLGQLPSTYPRACAQTKVPCRISSGHPHAQPNHFLRESLSSRLTGTAASISPALPCRSPRHCRPYNNGTAALGHVLFKTVRPVRAHRHCRPIPGGTAGPHHLQPPACHTCAPLPPIIGQTTTAPRLCSKSTPPPLPRASLTPFPSRPRLAARQPPSSRSGLTQLPPAPGKAPRPPLAFRLACSALARLGPLHARLHAATANHRPRPRPSARRPAQRRLHHARPWPTSPPAHANTSRRARTSSSSARPPPASLAPLHATPRPLPLVAPPSLAARLQAAPAQATTA